MPRMDGIEATAAIARLEAELPIVGVTGDLDKRERAIKAGMVEVLEKPLDTTALQDTVSGYARRVGGGGSAKRK